MLRLGPDDVGAGAGALGNFSGGRVVDGVGADGRGKGGGDEVVGAGVDEGLGVEVVVGVDVGVVAVDLGAVDVCAGWTGVGAVMSPVATVSAGGVAGVAAGAGSSATFAAVGISIGTMGASSLDDSLLNEKNATAPPPMTRMPRIAAIAKTAPEPPPDERFCCGGGAGNPWP